MLFVLFVFAMSCVPKVASFSGLSIRDFPFSKIILGNVEGNHTSNTIHKLITQFLERASSRASHITADMNGVHVTRSLGLCVCLQIDFCPFVIFLRTLRYLSFDLRILITPLMPSNTSL
jgi:hypothetical protein